MEIKEIKGLNDEVNTDYLDITQLEEGRTYEKVALVTSADPGLTKQNSGFARFFLKDVNANVICARLFDVKDFAFCGIKLSSFKNRPVKLKFVVQEFNGNLSLVIDGSVGISVYDGPFDTERFVGKIDYSKDNIVAVGKKIFGDSWVLHPEFETICSDRIGQGRVGALMRVFDMSLAKLTGMIGLDGIDASELMETFFVTMETLLTLEKNVNKYGVLEQVKSLDYLVYLNNKFTNNELRGVLLDASKAILGIGKPMHLLSHLVTRAINNSIDDLNLVLRNNSMILGTSTSLGGVTLSKF